MNNKLQIHRRQAFVDITVLLVLVSITFAVIELIHPYYFLMDDNQNSYLYVYTHSFRALTRGEISLYNFHQFLGLPFLATGQTGTLSPIVIISFLLSSLFFGEYYAAIDIMAYLLLVCSAIGMFLIIKKITGKRIISILGSIAWTFNTYNLYLGRSWMIVLLAAACVPYIFIGTMYLFDNLSLKGIIVSAIPKIIMFYCGHPQFFLWAMIFDFFTFTIYGLLCVREVENNSKRFIYYVLSFIPVILCALPLLLPMWEAMTTSGSRSNELPKEMYDMGILLLDRYIVGIFDPFFQLNRDYAVYANVMNSLGHIGYILLLAYIFGLISLRFVKDKIKRRRIISVYVISVLALIVASSHSINTLLYYVPIFNRFRWQFKYVLWFAFFAVIAATMILSEIDELLNKSKKYHAVIASVCVLATIINMVLVGSFGISPYWGLNMQGNLSNKPGQLDNIFGGRRYINYGGEEIVSVDGNDNCTGMNLFHMSANIATYYEYSNVLGYEVLFPRQIAERLPIDYYMVAGNVIEGQKMDIETLRYLGVSVYVVDSGSKETIENCTSNYGMNLVEDFGDWVIYEDSSALPIVRTEDGQALNYQEKTNSIIVTTEDSFTGGDILFMYSYHPNFKAYIDGKSAEVIENDLYTMRVNVPEGANRIEVVYTEPTILYGFVIGVCGMGIFLGCFILIDRKKVKV